jgi:hypothetical protein
MKRIAWLVLALILGGVNAGTRVQTNISALNNLSADRLTRVAICPNGQRFVLGNVRQTIQAKQTLQTPPSSQNPTGFVMVQQGNAPTLTPIATLYGDPRVLTCSEVQGKTALFVASSVKEGVEITRLDSEGNTEWSHVVLEGDAQAEDLLVDERGVAFLLSTVRGKVADTPDYGGRDVVVQRLGGMSKTPGKTPGKTLWMQRFGSSEEDGGVRLALDGDLGLWVVGNTRGHMSGVMSGAMGEVAPSPIGEQDGFVVRLDTGTGKFSRMALLGTPQNDVLTAVQVSEGNIFVAGFSYGALEGQGKGESDAFIAAYNLNDKLKGKWNSKPSWLHQYGSPQADAFTSLAVLPDGDVLAAGYSDQHSLEVGGSKEGLLVRYHPDGQEVAHLQINPAKSDVFLDVAANDQGQIYAVGSSKTAALMMEFASTLDTQLQLSNRLDVSALMPPSSLIDRYLNTATFKVSIASNKKLFKAGEPIVYHIASTKDGYLNLLEIDDKGQVSLLFPNKYNPSNRVRAGIVATLPSPEFGNYLIEAGEPYGITRVVALVSEKPLSIYDQGGLQTDVRMFVNLEGITVSNALEGGHGADALEIEVQP